MQDLKIIDEKQRQKVLRAIDKMNKPGFGIKGVEEELKSKGFSQSSIDKIKGIISLKGSPEKILNELEKNLSGIKPKSKNICPGIPARN